MKPGTVYIETEGRTLETRVRVHRQRGASPSTDDPELRPQLDGFYGTFPVLRTKVWALLHGYGWPKVVAA